MPEHATARRRTAPVHPRRISGPARPRTVPAVALPAPRGRTSAFERIRALPDHRVVDRLLRSRLWIWLIGAMLGGIVAMQVSLLRLNAGISRAVQTQTTLERQNADLQAGIAERTAGDRVREAAAADDMVDPPAGDIRYLRSRPSVDPELAARRMRAPSDEAQTVMASGGRLPGAAGAATALGTAASTAGATAEPIGASPASTTAASPAAATPTAPPAAAATAPSPTPTPAAAATAPSPTATPAATATAAPPGTTTGGAAT